MIISKHLHSCLLIKEQGQTILIDPGVFTYEKKALDLEALQQLDFILITHEHADHCFIPFIKELATKFPAVKIISNQSVVNILQKEGITVTTQGTDDIILTPVNHERVFDVASPPNVMLEIFNKLAHPGDSMSFTTNKEILALPLLGPSWMITQAAEKAVELQPKVILPIHDYHWKDEYRIEYYKRLKDFFATKHIDFKSLETGNIVEV